MSVLLHLFLKLFSKLSLLKLDFIERHAVAEHQIVGVEHLGKLRKLDIVLRVLFLAHPHLNEASRLVRQQLVLVSLLPLLDLNFDLSLPFLKHLLRQFRLLQAVIAAAIKFFYWKLPFHIGELAAVEY